MSRLFRDAWDRWAASKPMKCVWPKCDPSGKREDLPCCGWSGQEPGVSDDEQQDPPDRVEEPA